MAGRAYTESVKEDANSTVTTSRSIIIVIAILVLAASSAIAWYVTQSIRRPLNDAVDTIKNLATGNLSIQEAVNSAVAQRLKPIIMSTVTTVCGLAPLVFIPGAGTELYRGVGIVVMMGILFSVLITLAFLPCLLVVWFQIQQRFKTKRPGTATQPQ